MSESFINPLREPLITKTQHVIANVAPELLPHLRALRPHTMDARRSSKMDVEKVPLNRELVKQILSALRTANLKRKAQAAPVVLLEAAWSRVFDVLTNSAIDCRNRKMPG